MNLKINLVNFTVCTIISMLIFLYPNYCHAQLEFKVSCAPDPPNTFIRITASGSIPIGAQFNDSRYPYSIYLSLFNELFLPVGIHGSQTNSGPLTYFDPISQTNIDLNFAGTSSTNHIMFSTANAGFRLSEGGSISGTIDILLNHPLVTMENMQVNNEGIIYWGISDVGVEGLANEIGSYKVVGSCNEDNTCPFNITIDVNNPQIATFTISEPSSLPNPQPQDRPWLLGFRNIVSIETTGISLLSNTLTAQNIPLNGAIYNGLTLPNPMLVLAFDNHLPAGAQLAGSVQIELPIGSSWNTTSINKDIWWGLTATNEWIENIGCYSID